MSNLVSEVSYIIGFRAANAERTRALLYVLKLLRGNFPNLEILIVEQDAEEKLVLDADLKVKKVFAYNPGLYNRCWAFNVGVKNTNKNIFAFADSDVFIEKQHYLECFAITRDFEAITPNKKESINIKLANSLSGDFKTLNKRPLYTFAGGLIIMTRSGFEKTGGWDERFKGWGCEDEAYSHVIFNRLTSKSYHYPLYHIDHPRAISDGNQQEKYKENRRIMEEILSMNGLRLNQYINKLREKDSGKLEKYQKTPNVSDSTRLNFVLAITTYNRLDYLRACVDSFFKTKNPDINWQLIISDDGSTDGTKDYLNELERDYDAIIILNQRVNIHHQVNSILKKLSELSFDLCFKSDDDVIFRKAGWAELYWVTIQRTGFKHLVFYDKSWQPHINLDRSYKVGSLVSHCLAENIQGAFYTLTKEVIDKVGYFDEQRFGKSGLGHVDYTFRCCRAGYNELRNPYDVLGSNNYIRLQEAAYYKGSTSSKDKNHSNSMEIINYKKKIIQESRIYIPYNENFLSNNQPTEIDQLLVRNTIKKNQNSSFARADATFYPERGVSGFFGFLIKRFYNLSIDLKLFFIPRMIKSIGRFINKLGIDLINIED